jgi:Zn-dependent protease
VGVIRFRLFGFPVEVQPGFWILALVIGATARQGFAELLMVLGVIVASVLVHELGHALIARRYGQEPRITLHMMGGLTSWQQNRELGRGSQIFITLAGPLAGYALALAAFAFALALPPAQGSLTASALELLFVANVFWSTINLLPVLPFDGGQVMALALGPKRRRLAAGVSLVFGLGAAVLFFKAGMLIGGAFFAMAALSSFFAARAASRPAVPPEAVRELLARARAAFDAGDHQQAQAMARAALEVTRESETALAAIELGAWAALGAGDLPAARATLRSLPPNVPIDALLRAAVLEADGDLPGAAAALLEARRSGDARPELSAMLVRVLLAQGRLEEALRITGDIFDDVGDDDVRRVAREGLEGGAAESAAELYARLFDRARQADDAYQAARAFARASRTSEALQAVQKAVRAGLADLERIRADGELAGLLGQEQLDSALADRA